ncbi:HK97 gp10 family phage protein [Micromonospora sp. ATA32]|nr:HK97 gp10 family phage protein [Micromonospora sp. ATA32]
MADIQVDGLAQWEPIEAKLRTASGRIGAKGSAVVRRSTLAGEAIAKQLAAVDTGFMKSAVTHEFRGDGRFGAMEGEWGDEASYAPYVEGGTSRMAAQPFIGPSLDAVTPGFLAATEAISDPLD